MKKLLIIMLLLPTIVFANRIINLNSKNTINFNQSFNAMYVAKKQIEAITLCAKNPNTDIYITLYTPGGSISAGQLYFDTLNALNCRFHTITIFAASMGYQTVQNLGDRLILPSGTLMSHRARISQLEGELGGELDQILKMLNASVTEMEKVASSRVGISLNKYRDIIRDELWLTAEEAVKGNHADAIALVKCDSSLLGSSKQLVRTFFGAAYVEYSHCPLITAPLGITANDGASTIKFRDYLTNITKRIRVTL